MITRTALFATLLAMTTAARVSIAAPERPWDGIYAGINAGTLGNNSCTGGTLDGTLLDPTIATAFRNPPCTGNSAFVGGLELGDNVQHQHLLLGIGIDLDSASAKKADLSRSNLNDAPPPGTYRFSGRLGPSRFAIIAPRIGYASLGWLAVNGSGAANPSLCRPRLLESPTLSVNAGSNRCIDPLRKFCR